MPRPSVSLSGIYIISHFGLARGLQFIDWVKVSVRDIAVSSVNAIQPSEPRVQPSSASKSRDSGPFSDLIENAADLRDRRGEVSKGASRQDETSAAPQRERSRAETLAQHERGRTPAGNSTVGLSEKRWADGSHGPARAANGSGDQEPAAEAKLVAGASRTVPASIEMLSSPVVDLEASVEETELKDGETDSPEVATASALLHLPQTETGAPAAPGDTATTPEIALGGQHNEPATVSVPPSAGELTDAQSKQGELSLALAATPTAALASSSVSPPAEAEAAASSPAAGSIPRAQPMADQAQLSQNIQPANAAASIDGEAMPLDGDADSQLPQRQSDSQSLAQKPQDLKAVPQGEIPKAANPALDASAQKLQPTAIPEPVRALTVSFNPTRLQAANMNEGKPVPLNAGAIAVEIASRMRDGIRRFDIRLDPPELGRIDVRLEMDRSGNVKTRLTLDRPETLELMQRDARGLERALQQAGLKADSSGLEFSLRSHAESGPDHRHSGREDGREAVVSEGGERMESVMEGYRTAAFARGGIDIRI